MKKTQDSKSLSFFTEPKPSCYRVSELTEKIKHFLESSFEKIEVQGELSNFTAHSSGHWYFSLKDLDSQIRAVMFRSDNQKLSWKPEKRGEGILVKVTGNLSVYKARGEYQIVCQKMQNIGKGNLQEQFEIIKNRLNKEGLFERKQTIPTLPKHILIISSPTGAAIKDILNILKRRYEGAKVTLVPALVQGKEAVPSLLKALSQAEILAKQADVLIVTRGGGSIEDLWAFNDESLARKLFHFPLPIISAIGHEIDFTISDFIADLRAPTPSAAAELVVENAVKLKEKLKDLKSFLKQSLLKDLLHLKENLNNIGSHLKNIYPKPNQIQQKLNFIKNDLHKIKHILQEKGQHIDMLKIQTQKEITKTTVLRKQKLEHLYSLLNSLNPLSILNRGYCMAMKNNKWITEAKSLKKGDIISLHFAKGKALSKITQV